MYSFLVQYCCKMANGLHLYSAFIQSAVQFTPLIHPFTHQGRLAAMQGTNQPVRSNRGLGVLLKDTPSAGSNRQPSGRQLSPPEPHRPRVVVSATDKKETALALSRQFQDSFTFYFLHYVLFGRRFYPKRRTKQCNSRSYTNRTPGKVQFT